MRTIPLRGLAVLNAVFMAAGSVACDRETGETQVRPEPAAPGAQARRDESQPPAPVPEVARASLGSILRVAGLHHGAMERDFGLLNEAAEISVKITKPKPASLVSSDTLELEMTVDGYDTAAGRGSIQVMIDDSPADLYQDVGTKPLRVDLKKRNLKPGMHLIRAFAVRPWQESIKEEGALAATYFYYKDKTSETVDVRRPLLTFNGPAGAYHVTPKTNRILFDFLVTGTPLDNRGYKVRYSIDGMQPIVLTSWAPIWLEALPPGNHVVKVELIDKDDRLAAGPYSQVESRFSIAMDAKGAAK